MKWVKAARKELNCLMHEHNAKGVKSIALLHIVQKYYVKLSLEVVKIDPSIADDVFRQWDPKIRQLFLSLHLYLSSCQLKANKKRIRQSLGLLCSAYINFTLKLFGSCNSSTTQEEYCHVANTMYTFLNRMSHTAESDTNGRKQPLYFLNILLASQELVQSWKDFETGYFFLKLILGHRQLYTQDPETHLKFLALMTIFDNFSSKDRLVRKCLNDRSHRVPADFFHGMSEFLFSFEFDVSQGISSPQIIRHLKTGNIISSAKSSLKSKPIPEANLLPIKRYLKRIRKKRELSSSSHMSSGVTVSNSTTSFASEQQEPDSITDVGSCSDVQEFSCWSSSRAETIDEIMTNGASFEASVDDESENLENGYLSYNDDWSSDFGSPEQEYQDDPDNDSRSEDFEEHEETMSLPRRRRRHGSNDTVELPPVRESPMLVPDNHVSSSSQCSAPSEKLNRRESLKDEATQTPSFQDRETHTENYVSNGSPTKVMIAAEDEECWSDDYAASDASTIPYLWSGDELMDSGSDNDDQDQENFMDQA